MYPKSIYNRVTYSYGEPGAKYGRAGRLTLVQDASGGQEYFYDALGNVVKTIRSVIASKNEVLTYISGSEYDAWGRLRTMTYPDGEALTYKYNEAGELASFKGLKDGREYLYLEQNGYDQFGHLTYQKLGNGTRQEYTYEPVRQRLQEMKLYTGDSLLMHNRYAYDAVDNILSIQNDTLSRHAYSYDDLNRLISATGRAKSAAYTLGMSYDLMGKPIRKNQMTQGSTATTHDWAYAYTGSKPNAVTQIGTREYSYDGNGNPLGWEDGEKYRRMAWDEENRLTAVEDNAYLSRYVYDHTGERVVKTHSGSSGIMVNGVSQGTLTHNENTTLYVSPYFTVGKNGNEFTKHYFAGSQRVASKLGNGRFNNYFRPGIYGLTAGGVNYIERMQSIAQSKEDWMKNNGIAPGPPHMKGIYADPNFSGISYPDGGTPSNTYVPVGWPRKVIPLKDKDPNAAPGAPIQYYQPINNETVEPGFAYEGGGQIEESGRYFYHSDHLGSTGYVTDARGRVSQYVAYMPYGETLFEQHSNTREMPYLFNGKEKDEETGLYYYGARYYDAEVATWIGVDPMWGKYPDFGGYVYCMGNPVKYVDPSGGEVKPAGNAELEMIKNTLRKEDKGFVTFDKNGFIDKTFINSHQSESGNFNKLKEIVNSERVMEVIFDDQYDFVDENGNSGHATMGYTPYDPEFPSDKDLNGDTMGGTTTGESGFMGKTLLPDRGGKENSPTDNIKIIVNKHLSSPAAAELYSHEANGHGLLYIRNGGDHKGAGHQPINGTWKDGNTTLVNMIIESKRETVKNMKEK